MRQTTAILSFSGTRMAYILERNRDKDNPGEIDYSDYLDYCLEKIRNIISYYFEAGGHHLILEGLDVGLLTGDRGKQYAKFVTEYVYSLANEFTNFYRENNADVTFIGIDAIQRLPSTHNAHQLGKHLTEFNDNWDYDYNNRRQILWNIAAIPLYSLYQSSQLLNLDNVDMNNLVTVEQTYYEQFAKQVYGFALPMPNLYISSNTNGDYPISSRLPLALGIHYHFRLFYVPFPTFFMKQEHFDTILLDMLAELPYNSYQLDYKGQISKEAANRGYEYYKELSQTTENISGLFRRSDKR